MIRLAIVNVVWCHSSGSSKNATSSTFIQWCCRSWDGCTWLRLTKRETFGMKTVVETSKEFWNKLFWWKILQRNEHKNILHVNLKITEWQSDQAELNLMTSNKARQGQCGVWCIVPIQWREEDVDSIVWLHSTSLDLWLQWKIQWAAHSHLPPLIAKEHHKNLTICWCLTGVQKGFWNGVKNTSLILVPPQWTKLSTKWPNVEAHHDHHLKWTPIEEGSWEKSTLEHGWQSGFHWTTPVSCAKQPFLFLFQPKQFHQQAAMTQFSLIQKIKCFHADTHFKCNKLYLASSGLTQIWQGRTEKNEVNWSDSSLASGKWPKQNTAETSKTSRTCCFHCQDSQRVDRSKSVLKMQLSSEMQITIVCLLQRFKPKWRVSNF